MNEWMNNESDSVVTLTKRDWNNFNLLHYFHHLLFVSACLTSEFIDPAIQVELAK